MRHKLAVLVGAAIVAMLTTMATPAVSAAADTPMWSAPANVGNAGTSATPAMTQCQTGITWMVWKGLGNDANMYYSWLVAGGTWAAQQLVGGGGGTSTGPTVTCNNEVLIVAWKGVGNDQHMYYTSANGGNSIGVGPAGPLQWAPQQLVTDEGSTDESPSMTLSMSGDPFETAYLAWHIPNSTGVEMAKLTGYTGLWQPVSLVGSAATDRSPTLTDDLPGSGTVRATVGLIWPQAGNQQNRYSNFISGQWTNSAPLVGGSAAALASTLLDGPTGTAETFVAWQGSGNDTRIWYTLNDGSGWQPQQVVPTGGPTTTGLAAIDGADPNYPYRQDVIWLAWRGPQGQIEYIYGRNSSS